MKRIVAMLLLVVLSFGILACNGDTTLFTTTLPTTGTTTESTSSTTSGLTDQQIVDQVYEELDLGDISHLTNSSPRLIMPVSRDGATISWTISNQTYISVAGVISQPDNEVGDQTVSLVATITKGDASRQKTFTLTVIALPPLEETPPLIYETFTDYHNGDIIPQTTSGAWGPVSNKTGNSHFYVVDTVESGAIPDDSNALKVNAFKELQIEASLPHTYDILVIEADVYQTANGSPIYLQTSSSQPVIGFGLTGGDSTNGNLFYRTDNGDMIETPIDLDTWYKIRLEANLDAKTIEFFYYDDGDNLISCTPEPVTFTGSTAFTSLFIRSGSSTTSELNENSTYITNIVANRPEALPRPTENVKLGTVSGITEEIAIENGSVFTPEEPIVKNLYASRRTLVKDTDYTLSIDNPVQTATDGVYTVSYVLTNLTDPTDIKTVTSEVTIYSPLEPNTINEVSSTLAKGLDNKTTLTVSLMRPEGVLHYVISDVALDASQVVAASDKVSVPVTSTAMILEDLVVETNENVYLVVELNGLSNLVEHVVLHQEIVWISTAQEFYDALNLSESNQEGKYFVLSNDIDFADYTWIASDTDFVAEFDGQNHVISNLTIEKIGFKGGIFGMVENALIKNLVLNNITASSDQSASGLLASEIRGTTTIENIVITNSSNIVDHADGYGAIIAGRIRSSTNCFVTIRNVALSDTYMETKIKYGGGLIGGMDTNTVVTFEDIYLYNVDIYEATSATATGQMVGAIIGRVQGDTTISGVVGIDVFVSGIKNVGGLIGKSDEPTATVTITDVYLNGSLDFDPTNDHANILVGNIADQTPTATNCFASGFASIGALGLGIEEGHLIEHILTNQESWWTTNLPNILESDLWRFNVDGPILENIYTVSLPKFKIVLDYNQDIASETIYLRQGTVFAYTPPAVPGFVFVDWYEDPEMTILLAAAYTITMDETIYGKYDVQPASTVIFDTGTEGPAVDDELVNYGEFATEPLVPETMIGGVLKKVSGWTLEGDAFDFQTPITGDVTLTAVWEIVTYTVSFATGETQIVNYGELAVEPLTDPIHPAFTMITFGYWELSGIQYDFTTPVTSNLSLDISWVVPSVVEVTTNDQFHYLANHDTDYDYLLMNDLDFNGYAWEAETADFEGSFDGGGHKIANLTFAKIGIKGGIFTFVEDATIKNVVFDNVIVTSDQEASGLLAAEFRGTVLIDNIVILNSSNIVDNKYAGLLVGRIRSTGTTVTITNIAIVDTYVEAISTYGGGLVGGMDVATVLSIADVFMLDVTIKESTDNTGQMVGAIIGRIQGNTTIERIYAWNIDITGVKNVGGLIGKSDEAGVIVLVKDVYINGEIHYGDTSSANIVAGNVSDHVPTVENVYASGFSVTGTSGLGLESQFIIDETLTEEEAWWTTNMPNILSSALWTYHHFLPTLDNVIAFLDPVHTVNIDYNEGATDSILKFWDGSLFACEPPSVVGYAFDGWYLDSLMTSPLPAEYSISSDVTIYGKYIAMPQKTISFDMGTSGVVVDSQTVNYGDHPTEPVVPDTMFEGILKQVSGWTLDGVAFDFELPITNDITLIPVWEIVTYTVSFASGETQVVNYGELVVEPSTDPLHPVFALITFSFWGLDGVMYDFSMPVTSDLELDIVWDVPTTINVTTLDEFYYVATGGTDYNYVLMNDLDFTGYTWTDTGAAFKGSFNGNDHTISNLTFTATSGYGGIFARANNANIEQLVLDNISITSSERIGTLIGRTESNPVSVQYIVIRNCSLSGESSNGTGSLIGQVSIETSVYDIAILDTTLHSTNKNVGGLVGRVDQANMIADDIYINNLSATSTSTASSDVGLGAVVGYVTNYSTSIFSGMRIVVTNATLDGNAAGAFAGYLRYPGTGEVSHAYFDVTFVNGERTGIVGYYREQVDPFDQTNVYGNLTYYTTHSQVVDLANVAIPDSATWWNTNLNVIYTASNWTINPDGSIFLNIAN